MGVVEMTDQHTLHLIAWRADALVLDSYNTYLRTGSHDALRSSAEHAHEAVHALMTADGTAASGAQELIQRRLPGVGALMQAAVDRLTSDTTARLSAAWQLMQLPGPGPSWNDEERAFAMRLLTSALVSDDAEILDARERVGRIPHRRAATLLVEELGCSEAPWKAALSADEYKHLSHSYAPRSGIGRGRLCAALTRLDKERLAAMLAIWLDNGAPRDRLSSCLNAALAARVPAVLV